MAGNTSEIQQLEVLIGKPEVHKVSVTTYVSHNGELVSNHKVYPIVIAPVSVGKIPELVKAAGSLMLYLTDKSKPLDVDQMLVFHSNECLEILSVLSGIPREEVNAFQIHDAAEVLLKFMGVHMDFFVQRLLPLFFGALAAVKETLANDPRLQALIGGQMRSPS